MISARKCCCACIAYQCNKLNCCTALLHVYKHILQFTRLATYSSSVVKSQQATSIICPVPLRCNTWQSWGYKPHYTPFCTPLVESDEQIFFRLISRQAARHGGGTSGGRETAGKHMLPGNDQPVPDTVSKTRRHHAS